MRLSSWRGALGVAAALLFASCTEPTTASRGIVGTGANYDPAVAKVVISQVYGAGGNAGATLANDYVELFNAGNATATLTGWSIQYASATGTGNFGSTSTQLVTLSGSIAAGKYYLVKLAGGTVGAALPTADVTGTINMSGTAGKVALVDQATTLGCNGGSTPCSSAQLAHIIDLVGFGTGTSGANFYEGTAPAPTLSATTAAIRAAHGCTDTNNNGSDFSTGTPAPRNSSTAAAPCIVVVGPLDHIALSGGTSVNVGSTTTLTAELLDAAGQRITDPAATQEWVSADPATVEVVSASGNTGTVRGVQTGGPVEVRVTATSGGVTKTATVGITSIGTAVIVPSATLVSEVHYDNTGTDAGEAIEIEGDANTSLDGWSLVLYNGTPGSSSFGVYGTIALAGTIPSTCGARGVLVFSVPGLQNGESDGWALVNAQSQITELTSYEGTFTATTGPAAGLTSTAIGADESVVPSAGKSVQRALNGVWYGPRSSTFGACNSPLPLGAQGSVTVTNGKTDLALGMQTQFFYGGTDATGQPVTSVVWSTSNTSIITVDQKGVVTAKGLGAAQLVATAPDGATGTVDMTVYLAAGSTGIRLGHNTEFGEPQDANPTDDFLIRRPQYTVSYNPNRGGANWVSWNLDASHVGSNGRCPGTCYSADTAISNAGLPAYTTADWVSGSVWDRGHMAPSADWTSSEADNNTTFFLSNFLPQQPDLNQGPWEVMESALRDSVSVANGSREAYIIAGGIFANGTGLGSILNLGKIWIPNSTWKIVVITPAGAGLNEDGTLPPNTTVLAVNMPNVAGIRGTPWTSYLTTIASIEQATGYDFLAMLSDNIECKVEGRNCAPEARITSGISGAGWQTTEGQTVTFSGASSTDANPGDVLTMAWSVNGASVATGQTFSYPFDTDGTYEIKLTVSDNAGASNTASVTVTVNNVAPTIAAFSAGTILRGETYTSSGSFTDPGLDAWTAAVNYGDGSSGPLALSNKSFSLSHQYATAGTFTVTVSVNDGSTTSTRSATVMVRSAAEGIEQLAAMAAALALNRGEANALQQTLASAQAQIASGNSSAAVNIVEAFINQMEALMQSRRVSKTDGLAITAYASRVIAALKL